MLRKLLVATTALVLTTGAAYAVPVVGNPVLVSGTATFQDDGPANNSVSFSASPINFSTDLSTSNPSFTTPYLQSFFITETYNYNPLHPGTTDTVEADFSFTAPPGSGTVSGSGQGYQTFQGLVNNGNLSWTPADVMFSDGTTLEISLANVGGIALVTTQQTFNDPVTFTLKNGPTPVPEPGSLTLLGTGLLGLGIAMRRRRS